MAGQQADELYVFAGETRILPQVELNGQRIPGHIRTRNGTGHA